MKKYLKISGIILAASMLSSIGSVLITQNTSNNLNQNPMLSLDNTKLSDANVDVLANVDNLELVQQNNSDSFFAIVRGTTSDRLYGWGANDYGQLGVGDNLVRNLPTPIPNISTTSKIKYIKGGANFTLIVYEDNTVHAAGLNDCGQFGNKTTSAGMMKAFTQTFAFTGNVESFDAGQYHAGAVVDGKLYMWGKNTEGQVGVGTNDNVKEPTLVEGDLIGATLSKIVLGGNSSYIADVDPSYTIRLKRFFAWGRGKEGQLGSGNTNNTNVVTRVLTKLQGITSYHAGLNRIYICGREDIDSSEDLIWVAGSAGYGALGNGQVDGTSVIFNERLNIGWDFYENIRILEKSTIFIGQSMYSVGSADTNGVNKDLTAPDALYAMDPPQQIVSNSAGNTVIAVIGGKLVAWGNNSTGAYGIGNTTAKYSVPTEIDAFSLTTDVASTLSQKNNGSTLLATELASSIYNASTGVNNAVFTNWVDTSKFPTGTTFSMYQAPVADNEAKTLKLFIQPNFAFTAPDGAKAAGKQIQLTLTNLKQIPDSAIALKTGKPWTTLFKYEDLKKEFAVGAITRTKLDSIMDLSSFPADATFSVSSISIANPTTTNPQFTVNLRPNKYFSGGKTQTTTKDFPFMMDGFTVKPNSTVNLQPGKPWLTEFLAENIVANIGSGAATNLPNLNKVLDLTSFPSTATFEIKNPRIEVDSPGKGKYIANLEASSKYFNGEVVEGKNSTEFVLSDLVLKLDSKVAYFDPARWRNLGYAYIIKQLGVGASTDLLTLNYVLDLSSFPAGTTFEIQNPTQAIDGKGEGSYTAELVASKAYLNGEISTPTPFKFTLGGFDIQPDSELVLAATKPWITDSTYANIVADLGSGDTTSRDRLRTYIDTSRFPILAKFTIANPQITNNKATNTGTYTADLISNEQYKDGLLDTNPKTYKMTLDGFTTNADSVVALQTGKPWINDSSFANIVTDLGSGAATNETKLKTYIDVSSFPSGAKFSIENPKAINDKNTNTATYTANVVASTHYNDGLIDTTPKSYPIVLDGFTTNADSVVNLKPGKPWTIDSTFATIMSNLGSGNTTDETRLKTYIDVSSFPDTAKFTIENPKAINDKGTNTATYTANVIASAHYNDGLIDTTSKSYPIILDGFTTNADSVIDLKAGNPWIADSTFATIVTDLGSGVTTNEAKLKTYIDVSSFPNTAKFTIENPLITNNKVTKIGTYTADVIATAHYNDGLVDTNPKTYKITLDGFTTNADSAITLRTGKPWINDSSFANIITDLGSGTATNETKLKTYIDVSSFPSGAKFTIENPKTIIDKNTNTAIYTADVIATEHYNDGLLDTNPKTYKITLDGFATNADSEISLVTNIDPAVYNLNNINNKLRPNGVLDMNVFYTLFITYNFHVDNKFSVTSTAIKDGIFIINLNADKVYVDGLVVSNTYTFNITGLVARNDSTIKQNELSKDEVTNIINKYKPGDSISDTDINKMIDVTEFPPNTDFIVNDVTTGDKPGLTFKPSQVYKDGEIDKNTTIYSIGYSFTPVVTPTTSMSDLTWIIIGASAGGVVLLTIAATLIIRHMNKRKLDPEAAFSDTETWDE